MDHFSDDIVICIVDKGEPIPEVMLWCYILVSVMARNSWSCFGFQIEVSYAVITSGTPIVSTNCNRLCSFVQDVAFCTDVGRDVFQATNTSIVAF